MYQLQPVHFICKEADAWVICNSLWRQNISSGWMMITMQWLISNANVSNVCIVHIDWRQVGIIWWWLSYAKIIFVWCPIQTATSPKMRNVLQTSAQYHAVTYMQLIGISTKNTDFTFTLLRWAKGGLLCFLNIAIQAYTFIVMYNCISLEY